MAVRNFDLKFGAEFLESLPGSPGVYLVFDQQDELIYVGKAINLKRRLSQYRNTIRRKKHRRMRGIVKEAVRLEIQCAETHLDACLAETMLTQKHRPRWNIVGAYSFLYPLIGIRSANGDVEFCMTTTPGAVVKDGAVFEFHAALRRPSKVQEYVHELKRFWRHEVFTLAKIRKATGYMEWPVPQYKRDLLFLSFRAGVTSIEGLGKSPTNLLGFRTTNAPK